MENWKGLLSSKTVWGVIVMVIGTALGWGAEAQEVITTSVMLIVSGVLEILGAVLAIYGRIKAEKRIGSVV